MRPTANATHPRYSRAARLGFELARAPLAAAAPGGFDAAALPEVLPDVPFDPLTNRFLSPAEAADPLYAPPAEPVVKWGPERNAGLTWLRKALARARG